METISEVPPAPSNRFPLSFTVAESSEPTQNNDVEFDARSSQIERRAIALNHSTLARERLDLIEEFSEGAIPLERFRRALGSFDGTSYQDLLEERHSGGWCPYPTCAKSCTAPYNPVGGGTGMKLKLKGSSLYDVKKGSSFEPFCTVRCQLRSEYCKTHVIQEEGKEMLEDIEARRRRPEEDEIMRDVDLLTIPRPPPPAALPSTSSSSSTTTFSLPIIERNTVIPSAPNPNDAHLDFERPSSSSSSTPSPFPSASTSTIPSTPSPSSKRPRPSSSRLRPFAAATLDLVAASRHPTPAPSARELPVGTIGPPPVFLERPDTSMNDAEEGEEEDGHERDQGKWGGMEEEPEEEDEIERLIEEGLRVRKAMLEEARGG